MTKTPYNVKIPNEFDGSQCMVFLCMNEQRIN